MNKLLERILNFFENKSIPFRLRTSIFIISIFVLTTCDYYSNFTYDYHLSSKIEKLKSINDLKKIYKSDSLKLSELNELENRIFKRTHYSDRLRNLNLNQILKISDTTKIKSPVVKNDNTIINKPIRSLFWMVLTSNYFFIILIITLIVLPFTGSVHREIKNVLGSIAGVLIFIGVIYFITWVAYQIPLIWDKPYLNYILNFIIHSPFIYLIFYWNKTEEN
ncbi:MAG: hypothetical protein COB98_07425 [Flavobacteriaceae bacterium]|nr:MAG: hypothetical protein COB98_07425 [Flavobacteriaceae bacterium]